MSSVARATGLFVLLVASADAARVEHERLAAVEKLDLGKCSKDDVAAMNSKGPGSAPSSFPGEAAKCGGESWSVFKGWKPEKYKACITKSTGISSQCASCFSDSGKYGFKNCKLACMGSWCSENCLTCMNKQKGELLDCVGAAPPDASQC